MFTINRERENVRTNERSVNVFAHQQQKSLHISSTHLRTWRLYSLQFSFFASFLSLSVSLLSLLHFFQIARRQCVLNKKKRFFLCVLKPIIKHAYFLPKVNTYYITYIYSTKNRKWVHDVGHLQDCCWWIFCFFFFCTYRNSYWFWFFFLFSCLFFFWSICVHTNLQNWCIKARINSSIGTTEWQSRREIHVFFLLFCYCCWLFE